MNRVDQSGRAFKYWPDNLIINESTITFKEIADAFFKSKAWAEGNGFIQNSFRWFVGDTKERGGLHAAFELDDLFILDDMIYQEFRKRDLPYPDGTPQTHLRRKT